MSETNPAVSPAPPAHPRYYHLVNCNRDIRVGSAKIEFKPYAYEAGTLYGLYTTSDPTEHAGLAAMIEANVGVAEISEEQFWAHLGARPATSDRSIPRAPTATNPVEKPMMVSIPIGQPMAIENKAGIVVDGAAVPAKPAAVSSAPVEDVKKSLEIGDVRPTAVRPKPAKKPAKPDEATPEGI